MLRAEERLELHAGRVEKQIDGGIAPAILSGVIGHETDAQLLERREVLLHEHVDAVEHARQRRVGGEEIVRLRDGVGVHRGGDEVRAEGQGVLHAGEVESIDGFRGERTERGVEREDAAFAVGMHAVREKNPKRL